MQELLAYFTFYCKQIAELQKQIKNYSVSTISCYHHYGYFFGQYKLEAGQNRLIMIVFFCQILGYGVCSYDFIMLFLFCVLQLQIFKKSLSDVLSSAIAFIVSAAFYSRDAHRAPHLRPCLCREIDWYKCCGISCSAIAILDYPLFYSRMKVIFILILFICFVSKVIIPE